MLKRIIFFSQTHCDLTERSVLRLAYIYQEKYNIIPGLDCCNKVVRDACINLSQNSISFFSVYRFVLNIDLMAARQALTATGLLLSVPLADISRNVPSIK